MKNKHHLKHLRRALLASTVFLVVDVGLAFAGGSGNIIIDDKDETRNESIDYGTSVIVGYSSNGTLTINSGATVTNVNGDIGYEVGSTGTVTVTGEGSTWTNSGYLVIGNGGAGALIIENGGAVSSGTDTYVGFGGTGTVTVNGSGSTLSSSGDIQLGIYDGSGTLTIENGGAVSSGAQIAVGYEGTGTVTVNGSGSTLTSGDDIQIGRSGGTGTLTIENGGAVTAGSYFYVGNDDNSPGAQVTRSSGTVTVTGNGSTLTVSDEVVVGYDGNGTLTIADGGVVSAAVSPQKGGGYESTVTIASGRGSTGTLNIGAAAGQTAVAAGTLNAANVAFGAGDGTLVFNHTDTDYEFSAAISSTVDILVRSAPNYGTINQIAGFTTLSGDSSGFLGTTNVTGGTLNVTGTLGGTLNVSDAGTLSGYGEIGTTNILSRGTLSPGGAGSIGALNVNGDLTFESGSTYAVDLRGTENNETRGALGSDTTFVKGNVTINGGTVSVTALDASTSYLSGKTYTVINSEGTLSGAFTDVVSKSAFLTSTASYDANNAYLTIAVTGSGSGVFVPAANTPNQLAVARSLDSLSQSGTSLELYNSMLMLNEDEARSAYQQLSGDSYATAQGAFVQTVQTVNNTVNSRMRSITQGVAAPSITPLGFAEEDSKPSKKDNPFASYEKKEKTFDSQRFSAWTVGFGSWGKVSGTDGGLDTNIGNGGVLFGADGLVSNAWRLGVMGGYSRSSFDTATSDGNSDNYHVGVYGTGEWRAVTFRSGLNYAWSNVDNTRQVSALNQSLKGKYDADSISAFAELGYTVKTAVADFEPFAALSYSHVKTDGFNETGGSAALTVDEQDMNTTFTTIGMRTSKDVNLLGTAAVVRGTAGWIHAFGDVDPVSTARFATGDSFTVSGSPIDRNAALLEAGLDLNLTPASTLSIGYNGQIGKDSYEHGATAKLRVRF